MRTTLTAAAIGLAATLAAPAAQASDADKMVTILTSEEPQTQLMSMVLTMQSMQAGAGAYVLLCGPAGDLALKDAPEAATAPQPPKGMSPQALMQKIMEQGATVEVCAIYLPGKGVGADALLDGITAARPPAVAKRLLAEDTRIMSF
jgi:intracellular sulfur oxidation DsrE/DsrF family protein